MKKSPMILVLGIFFLVAACSSSDGEDVVTPMQEIPPVVGETPPEEEENPAVEGTDPTEGFTLGGLLLPDNTGTPPEAASWEFVDSHSDEFNYTGKGAEFASKWNDSYFNAWVGPALTQWNSDHSDVADGNLIISAARSSVQLDGIPKVDCGVITSKEVIKYPIYSEVRAKVANQVLSSNFWFLSPDDRREIDVLEIYGGDRPDQAWFAARPSTNTHVFVRGPGNEILQNINKQQHHTLPNEEPWRNDWHRFGVHWIDPFTLDFYYDGILVSEVRKVDIGDPDDLGIDRDAFMIIDLEDHEWRSFPTGSNAPVRATDEELADESKNKYLIDYVRTYRPKSAFDGGLISNGSFDDTELSSWYRKGTVSISTSVVDNDGDVYTLLLGAEGSIIQEVQVVKNTSYQLDWKNKNVGSTAKVSIHEIEETTVAVGEDWTSGTLTFNSGDRDKIYVILENTGSADVLFDALTLN